MKWTVFKTLLLVIFVSAQAFAQAGPNEGGGGNGINGKPLESYAVYIDQRPEFKLHVLPVLKKIKSLVPVYGDFLERAIFSKTWYFVPVSLNELSSDTIGVPFSTQQLAYQNERSVWIDDRYYSDRNTTALDRANLLVHELVMAEKLNFKMSLKNQTELIQPTPAEYDSVRSTTAFLMSDKLNSITGSEMALKLHDMGIYGYENNLPLLETNISFKIDTLRLARILFKLMSEEKMPSQNLATPTSDCRYNIKYDSPKRVLNFTVNAPVAFEVAGGGTVHFVQEVFNISDATIKQIDSPSRKGSFVVVYQAVDNITVGAVRMGLKIFLNKAGIQNITIVREVYSYDISKDGFDWELQGQMRSRDGASNSSTIEGITQCRLANVLK